MSLPIQRQSESYGVFDDGNLRFAKDYETHDLPKGLANMLAGPRISAGLNNPRGIRHHGDLPAGGVDTSAVGMGTGSGAAPSPTMAPPPAAAPTTSAPSSPPPGAPATPAPGAATNPASTGAPSNLTAYRQAVDTRGMDPADHAYHTEAPFSPHDSQGGGRDYDPNTGYQPSPYDEQQSELVGQDDDSGHNWGPEPHGGDFAEDLRPAAGGDSRGFGFGGYDDFDPHSAENLPPDYGEQFDPHMASFTEARRLSADDGPAPGLFTPNLFRPGPPSLESVLYGGEKSFINDQPTAKGEDWVTAAAVQPQVVPGWVGHGYSPGHRVGLPWRQQVIPGTVTHLDGQQLGVRWDDGQHSTEEPSDLRPL